ncbi:MAG: FHA domain-containing protein [Deltaproteobacteria bacterium]
MYKLVISDDEGHATVVPLLRDEITIGRQEGNTIRLTERNVSRSHARLLSRNGCYIVEDLGSYNGVTVNGERIDARAELAAGDQLGIGDYDLAFQSDVVATANTMPSPKPKSQPPARLVVLSEPAAGAEFTLTKPALRIGRDERLDIWINHKSISHEHAEVQVDDGKVTVFDLESANGMRVNGVAASRAILDAGDVLELGEVRFRFVPAQGAHSLEPLPHEAPEIRSSSSSRKPVFAMLLIGLLVVAGASAVLATMRGAPGAFSGTESSTASIEEPNTASSETISSVPRPVEEPLAAKPGVDAAATEQEASRDGYADSQPIEEPREWEGQLARARKALAKGRLDRAYSIANELPVDSVLRKTPEFAEIRYRYAQAHINEGERALEEGDRDLARGEAKLVLELKGITSKQRQDARRLMRSARERQVAPEARPNLDP